MKVFDPNKSLKKHDNKKVLLIVTSILVVISVIGISFATFNYNQDGVVVINSKVGEFITDDIAFTVMVDGVKQDTFPTKGSGYVFESLVCENGTTGTFDESTWKLTVSVGKPDKCTVSFKKATLADICSGQNAATCIQNIGVTNFPSELINDDPDGNVRFYGFTVNNYVEFNGEDWQIIGTFRVVNPDTGATETRLKIMKRISLEMAWDSNANNEWPTSSLNTELNGAYYDGLTPEAKSLIDKARWNLGGTRDYKTETALGYYAAERGTAVYSGRSTTYDNYVGLMYPSDYGYATNGGTTGRVTCLTKEMYSWGEVAGCKSSWIFNYNNQWTLTPLSSFAGSAVIVASRGAVANDDLRYTRLVRPVVYLKSNVKITSGSGTREDPYQLSL